MCADTIGSACSLGWPFPMQIYLLLRCTSKTVQDRRRVSLTVDCGTKVFRKLQQSALFALFAAFLPLTYLGPSLGNWHINEIKILCKSVPWLLFLLAVLAQYAGGAQVLCNDTVSVCLSVPSCTASAACGRFAAVVPAEGTIDCCTAPLQQARPPFDSHPQQHGGQRQMQALSCLILIHNCDCDSDDAATATQLRRPCDDRATCWYCDCDVNATKPVSHPVTS